MLLKCTPLPSLEFLICQKQNGESRVNHDHSSTTSYYDSLKKDWEGTSCHWLVVCSCVFFLFQPFSSLNRRSCHLEPRRGTKLSRGNFQVRGRSPFCPRPLPRWYVRTAITARVTSAAIDRASWSAERQGRCCTGSRDTRTRSPIDGRWTDKKHSYITSSSYLPAAGDIRCNGYNQNK